MTSSKTMAKASLICVAAVGALMTAVAARAGEQSPVTQIDLDGETITVACAADRLNDVWVRYAQCREIFNNDVERETAEQYCKPLAVAQACSQKSIPM